MTELPTEEQFRDCLGQEFVIRLDSGDAVSLTLAEVTSLGDRGPDTPPSIRRNPFALLFRGEQGTTLPQQTFRMENELLGAHDIFLVPLQPDAEGTQFESIFG